MNTPLIERVLDTLNLSADQRAAALERTRDVFVTAGAGSGKTSTLVGRYAGLLADGCSPRRVLAITFTKKAAREMRSRVRKSLSELAQMAQSEDERQRWLELGAQMDSARIGTIHSLCTEMLRAHPAEAGIDPRFTVLDEGLAAAYKLQAVQDSLKSLVEQPEYELLLSSLKPADLQKLLEELLQVRLEARESLLDAPDHRTLIADILRQRLADPALAQPIAYLRELSETRLRQDAGDKLADMVGILLSLWAQAQAALQAGAAPQCAELLYQARRTNMKGSLGTRGIVKETVSALKDAYDRLLNPLTGGAVSTDVPPSPEAEALFAQLLPLLKSAFARVDSAYTAQLSTLRALDFDDLEYGAQQLLRHPEVRARWQAELQALLVDEFQDTNPRQREIITALAGAPGRLFLVGDNRQSIYRFRRADVTVFSAEQQRITAAGGLVLTLDRTYRAHAALLSCTGDLLDALMRTDQNPPPPYYVRFSPLQPFRLSAPAHIHPPYVEIVLGAGADTESARPQAALALAQRLLKLQAEGQIQSWDDVALLFRASSGFSSYEDAFEQAGIPFVTVAGKGFYDRPEIRDLLNMLRALADPSDDLAFAGLLRSPAFGLSDAALYQLRQPAPSADSAQPQLVPYWTALNAEQPLLNEEDRIRTIKARAILTEILPLVDRVPVAELLKKLVDAVDYRAILATADLLTPTRQRSLSVQPANPSPVSANISPQPGSPSPANGSGGRLWRNLDKLLEDAQSSQQVNVRDFLDYLKTLNDAGAREGEAPAEALGAVRLMTIHKAKGLQFELLVLADAGRDPKGSRDQVYLSPELGLSFKLPQPPMLYRLARALDKDQGEAESQRLLYVALTRAKNRLIISAHAAANKDDELTAASWMKDLLQPAGLSLSSLAENDYQPLEVHTASGQPLRAWCLPPQLPTEPAPANTNNALLPSTAALTSTPAPVPPSSAAVNNLLPLYTSLIAVIAETRPEAASAQPAGTPAQSAPASTQPGETTPQPPDETFTPGTEHSAAPDGTSALSDAATASRAAAKAMRDEPAAMPEAASHAEAASQQPEQIQRAWRATSARLHVPASVTGQMVHKAIELWLNPEDPRLIPLLETAALNAGLAAQTQRTEAVRRALELLERLHTHPLWHELDTTLERHHEVPYTYLNNSAHVETGAIDLLYRDEHGWHLLDFKTDAIHTPAQKANLLQKYAPQIHRYHTAIQTLLHTPPTTSLCLLDDQGSLSIEKNLTNLHQTTSRWLP